eukprot:UN04743
MCCIHLEKSDLLYNIMHVKHCIPNFIKYVTFWIP